MQIDLKLLQRLLNHGRIDEVGVGYPNGMDTDAPAAHQDHLQTNNQGDNPMRDPSSDHEDEALAEEGTGCAVTQQMCDDLTYLMRARGVSTAIIAMEDFFVDRQGRLCVGNDAFSPEEQMTMAREIHLDCDAKEVGENLIAVLRAISRGIDESMGCKTDTHQELDEFRPESQPIDARFTYNVDHLGHVTVCDSQTGKEIYLKGSDALELLGQLKDVHGEGQIQHILSQYQHVMETSDIDQFNAEFASSSVAELSALEQDIASMRAKLQAMMNKAHKTGDVTGVFAADTFVGEVDRFEHALKDYLQKGGLTD